LTAILRRCFLLRLASSTDQPIQKELSFQGKGCPP